MNFAWCFSQALAIKVAAFKVKHLNVHFLKALFTTVVEEGG